MKNIFLIALALILAISCKQQDTKKEMHLQNGFYEVLATGASKTAFNEANPNTVIIPYNSIYDQQDFAWLQIDTSDKVQLELEMLPSIEKDTLQKSRLRITLSEGSSKKLETFTAARIMKSVAIVLDGEAITMHKVRDTIHGGTMQISWCGENACEKLYTKLRGSVRE
jgi:preprotein translocase subunit SecD